MAKIAMTTPLVEMDGDEMTRVLWRDIKDLLILPFVDLKTEYYDLGLPHRDETGDQVTIDAANAAKRLGVAVKCATITPNAQRVEEYNLHEMWKSPNGTIRAILDGTVFRAPIQVSGVHPTVRTWEKPITIARHAYGDVYRNSEIRVPGPGKAELVFTGADGEAIRQTIFTFEGPGIIQGIHNLDRSIASFARSCFTYALSVRQDLWFSAKDTISKTYDHRFKDIFQEIFDAEFKAAFAEAGITYFYTLIDDAVARVMRSRGGFIWACKNYDGDVMSDMLATAFGSLAMMTSVLVSPNGQFEYEAAHGTVTRHYYRYLNGEEPSTNPVATIFAWSGALRKRGEIDGLPDLCAFADALEAATLGVIESGVMTGDLANLWEKGEARSVSSKVFLEAIQARLFEVYSAPEADEAPEEDEADEEVEIITLTDTDGNSEDFYPVYRTQAGEDEYVVLLPAAADEGDDYVLIMRMVYTEDGEDYTLEEVDDEAVIDAVLAEYEEEYLDEFGEEEQP